MFFKTLSITLAAASAVQGVAVPRRSRQSACSHYTIIDTRGNGTPQGPSIGFRIMNADIRMQVSGGSTYNTNYPASMSMDSAPGTDDIVRHIHNALDDNPDECFVLEGYSLGATATVEALPRLTGDSFHAVKAVFLIGNPEHRAGLECNVDGMGGNTTRNSNGILSSRGGVPEDWVSKTMDVCVFVSRSVYDGRGDPQAYLLTVLYQGDGICDRLRGLGANTQHLSYPGNPSVQTIGTRFVVKKLRSARPQDRDDKPRTG